MVTGVKIVTGELAINGVTVVDLRKADVIVRAVSETF